MNHLNLGGVLLWGIALGVLLGDLVLFRIITP